MTWLHKKYGVEESQVFLTWKFFETFVYVHVDDQVRTKLDDKRKKMIFMGYDQKSKWYTLYNLNEGKMVICRDVEFNEDGVCDWKIDDGKKYDFLLILDEDEKSYEDH